MSLPNNLKLNGISIRQKITIILLTIMMSSLVLIGTIYHKKSQEKIEQVVVDHLRTVANNKKNLVHQVIRKHQERISLISSRTQLRLSINEINMTDDEKVKEKNITKIKKIISDAQDPIKSIRKIVVIDPNLSIIVSTSNQTTMSKVDKAILPEKGETYKTSFIRSQMSNSTDLLVSEKLYLNSELIGYLVLVMDLNDFSIIASNQYGLGSSEETTLVHKNELTGEVMPIYPESLISGYSPGSWVDPFVLSRQKDDSISTYTDHHHQEVLAVAYTFDSIGLGMVYKIDYEDALGVINEQKNFLIISSLITILISGGVALVLSRTITQPIIDLTYVAAMIASGDLNRRIQNFSKDELGMLAMAFNQMADRLIDANQVLEERVKEKTKELSEANEGLTKLNRDLERLSLNDSLTGISNRRAFDNRFDVEWKRCNRDGSYLGLVLIDIDFFKKYNDSLGHTAGDLCLKQVAQLLSQSAQRNSDLVARYGGEEFVLLLPNTSIGEVLSVANRLRNAVNSAKIAHPASPISAFVSISIGVGSEIPPISKPKEDYLERVDAALYESKDKGRNTISTVNNT